MALEEDLEFQKISNLIRQFGWEVTRQGIEGEDMVMIVKKKRPAASTPPGGGGAPATSIPT